jgi:hypothetical protein
MHVWLPMKPPNGICMLVDLDSPYAEAYASLETAAVRVKGGIQSRNNLAASILTLSELHTFFNSMPRGDSFESNRLPTANPDFSSYTLLHPQWGHVYRIIHTSSTRTSGPLLHFNTLLQTTMVMDTGNLLSAVVFGPQSKEPKPEYLVRIRDSLCKNKDLAPFVTAINELPKLWSSLLVHNREIATLSHGPQSLQALADWILTGASTWICKATHGMVTLPLLAIIQITQYFDFLRDHHIRHRDVIRMSKNGAGIQGYCSGFFIAAAVASSEDERDLVQMASNALRLAVSVGLYSDLGAKDGQEGQGTIVIHLKLREQLDDILSTFPKVRTNDPRAKQQ